MVKQAPTRIDKYFQGLRQFMPRSITIEEFRPSSLGDAGPVCAVRKSYHRPGLEEASLTDAARFTMLIRIDRSGLGGALAIFHSSVGRIRRAFRGGEVALGQKRVLEGGQPLFPESSR